MILKTPASYYQNFDKELCKEIALWRVALAFGFVFDVDDFVGALKSG